MADLRPQLSSALSAFGVSATVTRPASDAITTTLIWMTPVTLPSAAGEDFSRREPARVAAIPRADVPTFPMGTTIAAAEYDGGPVVTFQFDGHDSQADPEHWRVRVVL